MRSNSFFLSFLLAFIFTKRPHVEVTLNAKKMLKETKRLYAFHVTIILSNFQKKMKTK